MESFINHLLAAFASMTSTEIAALICAFAWALFMMSRGITPPPALPRPNIRVKKC